jgi:hypothetical protein
MGLFVTWWWLQVPDVVVGITLVAEELVDWFIIPLLLL